MHSPGVLGKPELRNDSQPKLFKVERVYGIANGRVGKKTTV